jgi:hypothetical protein
MSSAERGAETQLALLGPQDYDFWLARSDMYPRSWWRHRTLVDSVPPPLLGSSSSQTILLGLVAGLIVVVVAGGVCVYMAKKK